MPLAWRLMLVMVGRCCVGMLPAGGIHRGGFHIVSSPDVAIHQGEHQLVVPSENAWGDGTHPSTALCLEFVSSLEWEDKSCLDFGCGSGILAMAAKKLGCPRAIGVDIDDEVLMQARENARINDVDIDFRHVRSVVPGDFETSVVLANILVGQLSRQSMVATLALCAEPGANLCLSGFRPGDQTDVLRRLYEPFFDFFDYDEAKPDHYGSHFWGSWARLIGRRRNDDSRRSLLDLLSDDAALGD